MARLDPRTRRRLRDQLLGWYAGAARDLPWRRTADPYAIWISEAMLQQTRVEAVIEYWHAFLESFPTVHALAAADEDAVLARWSGLGYYRRARNLHAAARVIVAEHDGRFPDELEPALALPGVGPYTGAAVLSIAYDRPAPLVDGNVERVFARRFLLEDPVASGALRRDTWDLARELVPLEGAGTWNQALMELGAVICTPRAPRCGACPWQRACLARRAGRVADLPVSKPKPVVREVTLELAWCRRGDRVLLEQRPAEGRMAGMWQLPTRERTATGLFPADWATRLDVGGERARLRHSITVHRIQARVLASRGPARPPAGLAWVPLTGMQAVALTGMTKKVLRVLQPVAEPTEGSQEE